jgi:crotonobetainyl-CoA:carnitine CoA-transferase CaiB-like acyl-CoA transferase
LAADLKRVEAHVILENFGRGTMERLGCGYEQQAALNPRLVYLALKGYLAGPDEHRPALDEVVQLRTGLAFMTGPPASRCALAPL